MSVSGPRRRLTAASVAALGIAACALLAAGCSSGPPPRDVPRPAPGPSAAVPRPPVAPESVPDALPRVEPRSLYGNPPFYDQFGKRYVVLPTAANYVERGVASWYGPGFHAERTSTHEPYDMYGMTAAHKTLPLPCYVRVTNLQNGRSVVVRVNDRGPFVDNRIIDLSYTAAAKLDMLRAGTAMVEVRALDPLQPAENLGAPLFAAAPVAAAPGAAAPVAAGPPPPAATAPATAPASPPAPAAAAPAATVPAGTALYVQAGAFADQANAERLLARLRGYRFANVFIRDNQASGRHLYRVRIGPVPDVAEFDRVVAALAQVGVHDAHLAFD